MIDAKAKVFVQIAIQVLTSVLTVLVLVPGNQGEVFIQQAIALLKSLIGA